LFGSGGSDILLGGADNDTLYGDAAAGTPGDDWLEGGAGDDVLYGNAGNDSLSGGTDTDELRGDVGSDHYYYSLGDGSDTLYDVVNTGDVNTLWLGGGIALATTELSFDSQGYKLAFGDGGSISIKGNYSSSLSGGVYTIANAASNADIQRVEFSDGTGLSWLEMVQRGFTQRSTVVGAFAVPAHPQMGAARWPGR
jgi:Ca2+-binding RTX toxin-like protein